MVDLSRIFTDKSWSVDSINWDKVDILHFAYSADKWMTPDAGTHAFKYWIKDTAGTNQTFTVKQTVNTLPAGSYELSVKSMGEQVESQLL